MGKSPQQHAIQRILLPTVVSLSSAFSPLRIVAFTLHMTVLFEGPSGFIIRLSGNAKSYTSSPSIGFDRDTIEEAQVLWTMDVMVKSPP